MPRGNKSWQFSNNVLLMKRFSKAILLTALLALCLGACRRNKTAQDDGQDYSAKKSLQGVWVDENDEDVVFRIKGDTVFFPDSTSMPVYFMVKQDSFILCGANRVAYPILKHTPHLFVFVNQNGEQVRVVKSSDSSYLEMFSAKKPVVAINQNKVLKRDTVLLYGNERYHSYVQVNPTTYQVLKATYNDDGVEVDNVYHDNILHLSLYNGARKVFSGNILKRDFARQVPEEVLEQAIFSDLTFSHVDREGFHYNAVLVVPDTMASYIVEFIVGYDGKVVKRVAK